MSQSSAKGKLGEINISILGEWSTRKHLWKEFGIGPRELSKVNPAWVNLMMSISSADARAQEERLERAKHGK